ncbi:MAG: amidohydrolase [Myxococcota bacterium]
MRWVRAFVVILLVALLLTAGAALVAWFVLHPAPPDLQVWRNGQVLTMDADGSEATALAIERDRIVAVGSDSDMAPFVERAAVVVDLDGATVVPGFIEAHGHFPGAGLAAVAADLNSPPIASVTSIEESIAALQEVDRAQPGTDWLIGFGYDDTMLADKRHLSREDLDRVSTTRPVLAMHISGHMVAVNSVALERFEIDADTPDPPGGEIRKGSDGEPTGLLLETASRDILIEALKMPPMRQLALVRAAVQDYASQGFTTVQNGLAPLDQIKGLSIASMIGLIPQRVVFWPKDELGVAAVRGDLDLTPYAGDRTLVGAVKFVGDGSIQGYTGYLTEPYYDPGAESDDYRGYPNVDSETLAKQVEEVHCAGSQVAVHGNGDAAIDQMLDAWEAALEACPADDPRPILVHAQMAREDQLTRMKRLGVVPTFFSAHVYYWGDRHRDIFLGPDRAARISPAASAAALDLAFTTHLDTPVVPVDAMLQLWAPVARTTSSGQVLGVDQRISVVESLRGLTSAAAYQLKLEDDIGSIEPGKKADLVVLSDNPLTYDGDLRDIDVERTVADGLVIYDAGAPP